MINKNLRFLSHNNPLLFLPENVFINFLLGLKKIVIIWLPICLFMFSDMLSDMITKSSADAERHRFFI